MSGFLTSIWLGDCQYLVGTGSNSNVLPMAWICMQAEARHRDRHMLAPSTTAVVLSPHVAHCNGLRSLLAPFMLDPALAVGPQEYAQAVLALDGALGSSLEAIGISPHHSAGPDAELGSKYFKGPRMQVIDEPQRFIRMVDTVEKLQGQEADIVIYSACVSDAEALAKAADFYANLRRANVAFTRTKQRLIVVASRAMLMNAPSDMEQYKQVWLLGTCCRGPRVY